MVIESAGISDEVIVLQDRVEIIEPKKNDMIKFLSGTMRGLTGTLIGVAGPEEAIVRVESTKEVKVVELLFLGSLGVRQAEENTVEMVNNKQAPNGNKNC